VTCLWLPCWLLILVLLLLCPWVEKLLPVMLLHVLLRREVAGSWLAAERDVAGLELGVELGQLARLVRPREGL